MLLLPCALHLHTCPWLWQLPGRSPHAPQKHHNPPKNPGGTWSPGAHKALLVILAPTYLASPSCGGTKKLLSSLKLEKAMSFYMIAAPVLWCPCQGGCPQSLNRHIRSQGEILTCSTVSTCPSESRHCHPPKHFQGFNTCTAAHTCHLFLALCVSRAAGEGKWEQKTKP